MTGVSLGRQARAAGQQARALLTRRGLWGERSAFAGLVLLVVLIWLGTAVLPTRPLPLAAQAVPIVGANVLLELRMLRRMLAVTVLVVVLSLVELGFSELRIGSLVVVVVIAATVYRTAVTRERLGVGGVRGDALLADLRDRLAPGAAVPELAPGWHADIDRRLAGGLTVGGDFVVTAESAGVVQVVLVDVSGSGLAAATRALQLSGAFGGLLGAVPAADFLAEANAYVLRQDWEDGFATAVHVSVDTATGSVAVRSAGHPPAAVFGASAGRWSLVAANGPALGLLPGSTYEAQGTLLGRGDALLVYTDGLVEVAGQPLEAGIDRLLGVANQLVVEGFRGGVRRLLEGVPDPAGDDRAAVLLWRD